MEVHEFEKVGPGDQNFKGPAMNIGKKNKIALNEEQRKELLKISYDKNFIHGLIIELGLNTGLRVNELANLIVNNFNSYDHSIIVQDRDGTKYSQSFRCKTPKSNRILPITNKLSDKLKAHIGNRKTGYIFESQRKNSNFRNFAKRSLINMINEYSNKCKTIPYLMQNYKGISKKNIGFHCLRATYCSYLISKNMNVLEIRELMGHEYVDTTYKYIKQISFVDFAGVRKTLKGMNK